MSCIHFKFKNRQDYEKVAITGLEISGKELKEAIMKKKKIGHSNLEVTDAQTKKVYSDTDMIKRNASVVVMRSVIPNAAKLPKTQHKDPTLLASAAGLDTLAFTTTSSGDANDPQKTSDLTSLAGSEEDKVAAMMKQAGVGYTAEDYAKYPARTGINPTFLRCPPPRGYVCNRCRKPGHWIQLCPTNGDPAYDKKNRQQEQLPKTSTVGSLKSKHGAPAPKEKEVPEELKCPICKKPMKDAVVIPCCVKSFCDECIREHLLENDFVCPLCEAEDVSPDSLMPNKTLRASVKQFKSQVAEEKGIAVASLFSRTSLTPHQLSTSQISKPLTSAAAFLERLTARAAAVSTASSSSSGSASQTTTSTTVSTTPPSSLSSSSSQKPVTSFEAAPTTAPSSSSSTTGDSREVEMSFTVKDQSEEKEKKKEEEDEEDEKEEESRGVATDKISQEALTVPEPTRRGSPSSSPGHSRSKSPSPLEIRKPTAPILPQRKPPPPHLRPSSSSLSRHPKHPLSSLLQPHTLPIMAAGVVPPQTSLLPLPHPALQNQVAAATAAIPGLRGVSSIPGRGVIQTILQAPPPSVAKDYRAEAEFLLSQKRPRASSPPLTAEEFYRQQKFLHQFIGHKSPAPSSGQGSAYSHSSGSNSDSDFSDSYSSPWSGSESDYLSRTPSPSLEPERHHHRHHHHHHHLDQVSSKSHHKSRHVRDPPPTSSSSSAHRERERERVEEKVSGGSGSVRKHKKRKREEEEEEDDNVERSGRVKKRRKHHKRSRKSSGEASAPSAIDPHRLSSDPAAVSDPAAHERRSHRRRHRHKKKKSKRSSRHRHSNNTDEPHNMEEEEEEEEEKEGQDGPNVLDRDSDVGLKDEESVSSMSDVRDIRDDVGVANIEEGGVKDDQTVEEEEEETGRVSEEEEERNEVITERGEDGGGEETRQVGGGGGGQEMGVVVGRHGSFSRDQELLDDIDLLLADEQTPTVEKNMVLPTPVPALEVREKEEEEEGGGEMAECSVKDKDDRDKPEGGEGEGEEEEYGEGDQLSLHTEETIDGNEELEDMTPPPRPTGVAVGSNNGLEEGEVLSDAEELVGDEEDDKLELHCKQRLRSVASTVQAMNSSETQTDVTLSDPQSLDDDTPPPPPRDDDDTPVLSPSPLPILPPPLLLSPSSLTTPGEGEVRAAKRKHRRHHHRHHHHHGDKGDVQNHHSDGLNHRLKKRKRREKDVVDDEVPASVHHHHHHHKQRKQRGDEERVGEKIKRREKRKGVAMVEEERKHKQHKKKRHRQPS